MIKVSDNSQIYVYCPANKVTGGAELMHQLVDVLRRYGRHASIWYFDLPGAEVPDDYKKYDIDVAKCIVDDKCNIEVFYEGIANIIFEHKKTQKFLWWISVDNFYFCSRNYLKITDLWRFNHSMSLQEFWRRLKLLRHGVNVFSHSISLKSLTGLPCGYQSEYAHHFLLMQGFTKMVALKDFVNTDYQDSSSSSKKQDIVLYNPKKGFAFTQRLMQYAPDLNWVPLQGMNREQLKEVLQKAKLYIDFGNHPGKDRLPRECVMCGCCVITGKEGAAAYYEDVAIPLDNKFDACSKNIPSIVSRIREILNQYETANAELDYYRRKTMTEQREFEEQVCLLFDCNPCLSN